jgi:3-hydroxy acid dehydrogenase / malonic semialdehyde reductase
MQRALVTGATSGIGRSIAVALRRAGHEVLATGRNQAALRALAAEAPGIETLCLDLSDRPAVEMALRDVDIDILINNAGIMPTPGPFGGLALDETDHTVEVNLQSVLWLTRVLLPRLRASKAGHVIFNASTAAHAPGPNFAVYAATKAAISAFATSLRAEVAADGVRVTELVLGRVQTALYESVLSADARQSMYADGHSLQPSDVAEAVLAVLRLPARAAVTRLDLMPTRPVPPISLK